MRRAGRMLAFFLAAAGCHEDVIIETPPVMQVAVERLEFGAVAVGRSASQFITVQNAGAGILRLGTPGLEGGGAPAFSTTQEEYEIQPAAQGRVKVTFAPPEVGRFDAELYIRGNDPQLPAALVLVGGDGFRQGALEVWPSLIDFGLVNAGSSADGSVTVRNGGNGDLLVTEIGLTPETSADFHILSSTHAGTLAEGQEVPLRLAYRPGLSSQPPGEGTLLVKAADPLNPQVKVRLLARLNRAPVANAGADIRTDPLKQVVLDGTHSYDADGDLPLQFEWTLVRRPDGSLSELDGAAASQPVVTPDLVGLYEAELWVVDSTGLRSLLPDRVAITAVPAERVLVELVWDSPVADLDLHLVAPGGDFGGLLDCFWGNRSPDWGVSGDATDDPLLRRDDLAGFGPEVAAYENPIDGVYQLIVDYYASHTPSGIEPTGVTMRVFVDGALAAEISRRLERQGSRWLAATLQWPEGAVVGQDVMLQ